MVSLRVNGDQRADAVCGEELVFRATAEVPKDAGFIVALEWDLLGSGGFSIVDAVTAAPRAVLERPVSFAEPGTYFPTVRVVAQRDAEGTTPYARLQNLARVRVVVGDAG